MDPEFQLYKSILPRRGRPRSGPPAPGLEMQMMEQDSKNSINMTKQKSKLRNIVVVR